MSDNSHPAVAAINRAYAERLANAKAQAPQIAARLLRKHRTLGRAVNAAWWRYSGFLAHMVVDQLHEPHAAREKLRLPPGVPVRRPRGTSALVQAASAPQPPPLIRRRRG